MSIQRTIKKNFYINTQNFFLIIYQIILRFIFISKPRIFFRYQNRSTHPAFSRFYDSPPLNWSNPINYELAHWINYPAWLNGKPFIIEVNDHPLSAVAYRNRGLYEPAEILIHLEDAVEVYSNKQCKKILLPCDGFENIFRYYLGDSCINKFERLPSPGCQPKIDEIGAELDELGFACLASDYDLKAVDIVLDAWQSIEDKRGAKLYLACPNIPPLQLNKILLDSSIVVIDRAPLSDAQKNKILQKCSVTISPTHVHAGGNIIEGMEYGHAIIHFEMHTTAHNHMGYKVNMPYHFYVPELYAKSWMTMADYLMHLTIDKKNGLFNSSVNQLAIYMQRLINDSDELFRQQKMSLACAQGSQSLVYRNKKLVSLYRHILK